MKWKWILFWSTALFPMFVSAALYAFLPDVIPLHWNRYGVVDSTATKFPSIFLLPLTVLLFSCITALLPRLGEDLKNEPGQLYTAMMYGIVLLGALLALSFLCLTFVKSM